ncbi:MAG: hypothetical protein N4A33_02055 [Bacteriovoracaceae bacterium]|jgi:hypothetical protein|nr:hypothetical protein [Bacteriovoracaceae bacterium]
MKVLTPKILLIGLIFIITSCLPTAKETTCAANEAFDPTTRVCVPTLGSGPTTVFIQSKSPATSYLLDTNSAAVGHSISVSDVYSYGYTTKWIVHNGISSTVMATNTSTYVFSTPSTPGNYILEAIVYTSDGLTQLDNEAWNITVSAADVPQVTSPTPATTAYSYTNDITTAQTLGATINNPNANGFNYEFKLDGVILTNGTSSATSLGVSTTITPSTVPLGIHILELNVVDSTTPTTIYDSYIWTINIIAPSYPQIVSTNPSYYNAINIIDGETFAAGGYRDVTNTALTQICVDVDNYDKDSTAGSDIDIIFEINGAQQGVTGTFSSNTYCHNTFDTQNLSNSDLSESKTLTAKIVKVGTTDIIEIRQWNLSIRPRNMRPQIQIDSTNTAAIMACTQASSVSYTGCSVTQSVDADNNNDYTNHADDTDNSQVFAIELISGADPDIDSVDDYEVVYSIKQTADPSFQEIDGASNLTATDCKFTANETQTGSGVGTQSLTLPKLQCNLPIDAFGNAGHIAPGSYTISAYIRDTGSTWDVVPKESNTVTWQVNVTEIQSANSISIAAQSAANLVVGIGPTESWIEDANSSCVGQNTVVNTTNQINETEYVILHTLVRDIERDDFTLSIKLENGMLPGFTSILPQQTITRTDDNEFYEVESCFQIPEWVVFNNSHNAATQISISVTDIPDVETPQTPGSPTTLLMYVNNNNPAPTIADNSAVDLSSHYAFGGIPYTITAPALNSLPLGHTLDGINPQFYWQFYNGISWENIPNSNSVEQSSNDLIWTPPLDYSGTITLRVCVGDDGFGNDASDITIAGYCDSNPNSVKEYQNINITNVQKDDETFASTTDDKQNLASWFDETQSNLYTAHSEGTNIVINKYATNVNNILEKVHTITMISDTATASQVSQLSMTGVDSNDLFIAYTILDGSSVPRIRVRRINIANNHLSFRYQGFFTAEADTTDQVDGINYNTPGSPGFSLLSSSNGSVMTVTFNTVDPGDRFDIITSTGNESFIVGTGPTDLCSGSICPSTTNLAAQLESAINNHINPEISQEIHASAVGNVVTITGAPTNDYYDEASEVTSIIGNIETNGSRWVIPYADATNSFKVGILWSDNIGHISSATIGNPLSPAALSTTSTFTKEIKIKYDSSSSSYIIATINGSDDVDTYSFNNAFSSINYDSRATFLNGMYNNPLYNSSNLDLALDPQGNIFIATVNQSSGTNYLGAIYLSNDFSTISPQVSFSIISPLTSNITDVAITAGNVGDLNVNSNEATVAIFHTDTTPSKNIYLSKLKYSAGLSFEVSSDTSFSVPKLNLSNELESDSKVIFTPTFGDLTKGHSSPSSTIQDNLKDIAYLLHIEENGANSDIKMSIINTNEESIMGLSTTTHSSTSLLKN